MPPHHPRVGAVDAVRDAAALLLVGVLLPQQVQASSGTASQATRKEMTRLAAIVSDSALKNAPVTPDRNASGSEDDDGGGRGAGQRAGELGRRGRDALAVVARARRAGAG